MTLALLYATGYILTDNARVTGVPNGGGEFRLAGSVILFLVVVAYIVIIAIARGRTKNDTPESPDCEDLALSIFCGPCSLCQILRKKVLDYGCCDVFRTLHAIPDQTNPLV